MERKRLVTDGSLDFTSNKKKRHDNTGGAGRHDVVQISSSMKAAPLKLADDGFTLLGEKGYRMALATHGVERGEWFFEIENLLHQRLVVD